MKPNKTNSDAGYRCEVCFKAIDADSVVWREVPKDHFDAPQRLAPCHDDCHFTTCGGMILS